MTIFSSTNFLVAIKSGLSRVHNETFIAYWVRSFLIALIPTLLLAIFVFSLRHFDVALQNVSQAPTRKVEPATIFTVAFVGPFIETILIAVSLALAGKVLTNKNYTSIISAIALASLHAFVSVVWAVVVFWSFYVYCSSFQAWGGLRGFATALSLHIALNTFALVFLIFESLFQS
jgi:hypothetical protein